MRAKPDYKEIVISYECYLLLKNMAESADKSVTETAEIIITLHHDCSGGVLENE